MHAIFIFTAQSLMAFYIYLFGAQKVRHKLSIARRYTIIICSTMTVWLHRSRIFRFSTENTFAQQIFYRVGNKFKTGKINFSFANVAGILPGERSEPISNFIKLKMKAMHFLYTMFPAISLSSCQPDGVVTKSSFLGILKEIENWTVYDLYEGEGENPAYLVFYKKVGDFSIGNFYGNFAIINNNNVLYLCSSYTKKNQ